MAAEYFNSAPKILEKIPLAKLGHWVSHGNEISKDNEEKALAYFSLLTSAAEEKLKELEGGLSLPEIDRTLRLYIQGLSGRQIAIREANGFDELLANFLLPREPTI